MISPVINTRDMGAGAPFLKLFVVARWYALISDALAYLSTLAILFTGVLLLSRESR